VVAAADATLDNAHVVEDYLARTTTMYRIIQCHQVVLVVERVEASTLSTLSGRKIMRSDNFKSYRLVLPRTSPEIHGLRSSDF
jgi:hypothetical protein